MNQEVHIHPTADVAPEAQIGAGTFIWHQCQVREGARIGRQCVLSKGVYVDTGVILGDRVKIQNYVSVYHGVTIDDGVFCGPHCVFTNDKSPRAINPDGSLKSDNDWELSETHIKSGASIGANAVIVCGVTVGSWAMVGAGSVVTRDVPDHGLVMGNPARLRGFVCHCGGRLRERTVDRELSTDIGSATGTEGRVMPMTCQKCGASMEVKLAAWERIT